MTKRLTTLMAITTAAISSCCNIGSNVANQSSTDPIITKEEISVENGMFTAEIMHKLGKVGDAQLSPKGDKVLYGVSYTSIEQNKGNRELYVMDVDGSNNIKLTNSTASEVNARWINNGAKIIYMRSGKLFTVDFTGTTLENEVEVSSTPEGMEGFELSPNGTMIMYVKQVKALETPASTHKDLDKVEARAYSDLMYRHWDHFVETIPHTFIASFNGSTVGSSQDILPAEDAAYELPTLPFGGLEQLNWSPNGEYIAYSCRKVKGKEYAFSTNSDIYLYNVKTKETKNLTEGMMGYDTEPLFSPDGSKLAWISMPRGGYEADKRRLFIIDLLSGSKKELTSDYKYNVDAIAWAPKGDKIFFSSCVNAITGLFEVDINKVGKGSIADNFATGAISDNYNYGEGIKRITPQSHICDFGGITPIADEAGEVTTLLSSSTTMLRPTEIVSVNVADGSYTQLTKENDAILAKLDTPTMEQRWMKTVDGKNMHTWIVYPPNFDKSKKYPAILMCLGGPQGTISQSFSTRWNYRLMASKGYVVILPNRRGTTAFGQPWCEQISGDYCGLNIQDYFTSTDTMQKEPYIGKIAATGASYGGYSVYYLAGVHKNRYSALIAHAGIFNQEHMYMMTEEMWFPHWDNGGAPWDNNPTAKRHYANSPHKLIKNWNTPILVTHGEIDYRVPVDQGMAAFNAAQMMGVESKLVLFPNENHWILKPQNSIFWNREFFAWLDKYCK